VSSSTSITGPALVVNLKLGPDHKFISSSPDCDRFPLNMKHILEVKTLTATAPEHSPGPDQGEGVDGVGGGEDLFQQIVAVES